VRCWRGTTARHRPWASAPRERASLVPTDVPPTPCRLLPSVRLWSCARRNPSCHCRATRASCCVGSCRERHRRIRHCVGMGGIRRRA
jgi:hypothetical protein